MEEQQPQTISLNPNWAEEMIFQLRSVKLVPWARSINSMSTLSEKFEPSTPQILARRLVQILLAVYLLPALLIVLLIGVLGIFVVSAIRLLARLQDRNAN